MQVKTTLLFIKSRAHQMSFLDVGVMATISSGHHIKLREGWLKVAGSPKLKPYDEYGLSPNNLLHNVAYRQIKSLSWVKVNVPGCLLLLKNILLAEVQVGCYSRKLSVQGSTPKYALANKRSRLLGEQVVVWKEKQSRELIAINVFIRCFQRPSRSVIRLGS